MNEKPLPSAFRIFSPLGERRWIPKNGGEMIPNSVDGIFECSITKYCVIYLQEVGWGLFIQPARKFGTEFRHSNIFCLFLKVHSLAWIGGGGGAENWTTSKLQYSRKKSCGKFRTYISADWKRGSLHIFKKKPLRNGTYRTELYLKALSMLSREKSVCDTNLATVFG